ncbi:hypothetical protein DH09_06460 [Bacillaceae bacterium JMAK1]|nr:hypothetical protein DH09_06460 [Bacillaceae bacterium JMAK1]
MKAKLSTAFFSFLVLFLIPVQSFAAYGEDDAGSEASTFLIVSLTVFSFATIIYLLISMFKDNN